MTSRYKTQMTDKLWSIHMIMAEQILRAFFDFLDAPEVDKPVLEKRLFNAIKKRSRYSQRPSA